MKTILVPVDFSAQADAAADAAIYIARKTKAAIRLLHVVQDFNFADPVMPLVISAPAAYADLAEEATQMLRRKAEEARFADLPVSFTVSRGELQDRLAEAMAEIKPELMVVGTKGAEGMYELFIGSQAEKMVRHAPCPVLTVREGVKDFALRNVILTANFDDECYSLVNKLQEWQALFGFCIHVLHVNTPLNYNTTYHLEDLMEKFIGKYHLKNYTRTILDEYAQADGIMRFADKIGADVIAMATHGRTGVAHLLDGSVTEDVVNHAKQPVLAVHL
jgi:nucleotide-binding universal stress UspA family protein